MITVRNTYGINSVQVMHRLVGLVIARLITPESPLFTVGSIDSEILINYGIGA